MFSKYKKPGGNAGNTSAPPKTGAAGISMDVPKDGGKPKVMRKPSQAGAAQVTPLDKERKRKERMGEIKLELHRALLDNLNLAALEKATEQDLRQEINAITGEVLEEKSIVLNREDRQILNQELYDEVTGLGPLETLLKDDTVNDI